MANPLTTNPLANISYTGAEKLSINPDDLNFQKGTIAAAGGLIKGYLDKQEENKLSTLNEALSKAQVDGNEDLVKNLIGYSNTFEKSANRDAARKSIFDTLGSTQTGNIMYGAQQALTEQNPELLDQQLAKLNSPGLAIAPAAKADLLAKLEPIKQGLGVTALSQKAFKDFTTANDTIEAENTAKIENLLKSNPTAFAGVFDYSNGKLSPTTINEEAIRTQLSQDKTLTGDALETAVAAQVKAASAGMAAKQLAVAKQMQAAGITIPKSQDVLLKDLFNAGVAKGDYPIATYTAAIDRVKQLINVPATLNPEAQAKLAVKEADITAKYDSKISLNKEIKALTEKLGFGAASAPTLQQLKTDQKSMQDAIMGISDDWIVGFNQDGRQDTLNKATELLTRSFANSDGKMRPVTPGDIALAIQAYKEKQGFSWVGDGKDTIDADALEGYVKNVVGTSKEYDQITSTKGAVEEITKLHNQADKYRQERDVSLVNARNEFLPNQGNKQIIENMYKLLRQNGGLPSVEAKATSPTSASKPNFFDKSQAVSSVEQANANLLADKASPSTPAAAASVTPITRISPQVVKGKIPAAEDTVTEVKRNNYLNLKDTSGKTREFATAKEGKDAATAQIEKYFKKSPIDGKPKRTIEEIISTIRPSNDPELIANPNKFISQNSYVDKVAKAMGVKKDETLNPTKDVINKLLAAVTAIEHGKALGSVKLPT